MSDDDDESSFQMEYLRQRMPVARLQGPKDYFVCFDCKKPFILRLVAAPDVWVWERDCTHIDAEARIVFG
jgi:hypothetical protein